MKDVVASLRLIVALICLLVCAGGLNTLAREHGQDHETDSLSPSEGERVRVRVVFCHGSEVADKPARESTPTQQIKLARRFDLRQIRAQFDRASRAVSLGMRSGSQVL